MWAHAATQRNVEQPGRDGAAGLGVGTWDPACGETGDGRMLEPSEMLEELIAFFQPKLLRGQNVVVTAGPTYEAIDPVRGRDIAYQDGIVAIGSGDFAIAAPYGHLPLIDPSCARTAFAECLAHQGTGASYSFSVKYGNNTLSPVRF